MPECKMSPLWERTNDAYGHKPKFAVTCFRCGEEMPLRHSVVDLPEDNEGGLSINQMSYKCKFCAWFITFRVKDDADYLRKVLKEYRSRNVTCPVCEGKGNFETGKVDVNHVVSELNKVLAVKQLVPVEDWKSDDDEIAKQLEALGYYGGAGEMSG